MKEDHRLPFVEFRAAVGVAFSGKPQNNGLTALMSRMLVKGTGKRTAEDWRTRSRAFGGSLDPYSGNNSFGISAEVLRDDFAAGLNLVADVLQNPLFPEGPSGTGAHHAACRHPGTAGPVVIVRVPGHATRPFGEHGYGLDVAGTESSVSKLTGRIWFGITSVWCFPNNTVPPSLETWMPMPCSPRFNRNSGAGAEGGPSRVVRCRGTKEPHPKRREPG